MSVSDRFIDRIKGVAQQCLDAIDRGQARGHYTADESNLLTEAAYSKKDILLAAHKIAVEHEGRRCRDRRYFFPEARARQGLYLSNEASRPTLYVYGSIGDRYGGGITAETFQEALSQIDPHATLALRVHSDGGDFADGVAIHSMIQARPGKTFGYVDGMAASAASVLLMPCDVITMSVGSKQMIHFASMSTLGSWTQEHIQRALDVITATNNQLLQLYLPRWNGTKAELAAALKDETYFTPEQAIARGLADRVTDAVTPSRGVAAAKCDAEPIYTLSAYGGSRKTFELDRAEFKLWLIAADQLKQ